MAAEAGGGGRPARVLIVDDHPVFRAGLVQVLDGEPGLTVCGEAGSVEEALDLLDAGAPDLLVIDISLGGASGLDLVKQVRQRRSGLPMLVLSMHDETLFAERALRAGAKGYVNKQEAVGHMIAAIRKVLAGETYLSRRMAARLEGRRVERSAGREEPVATLSDRELEVFSLIGEGLGTREIAERLGLSVKTVETYREHIKNKLLLDTATELTRRAVAWVLAQG